MKRITALALLVSATLLFTVQPAQAEQNVDETLNVGNDVSVYINNISGSIVVIGWDKNEVHVEGTLGDDIEEFICESDGDDVEIRVILEKQNRKKSFFNSNRYNDTEADLEIHIPHDARLAVGTVSADIEAEGINGRLELSSVSGDIDASGKPEQAEIESVSGDLSLELETSDISVSTVSGRISANRVNGEFSAESVSGDIRVDGELFTGVEIETVSGEIDFNGDLDNRSRNSFSSHSGEIHLTLPENISAEFDLTTFNGDIDTDFGKRRRSKKKFFGSMDISFQTGSGDVSIEAETFSGDIVLEAR